LISIKLLSLLSPKPLEKDKIAIMPAVPQGKNAILEKKDDDGEFTSYFLDCPSLGPASGADRSSRLLLQEPGAVLGSIARISEPFSSTGRGSYLKAELGR